MVVHLYTLCWNEEDIIPYVLQYWERIRSEVELHVVVFDNGSTDKSLGLLSPYGWIEVRHFDTDGMNDIVQKSIKNSCWKESKGKCDFVIVCDMDEVLYSNCFKEVLDEMKVSGCNIMGTKWYAFCGDKMPVYSPDVLLHEQVKYGYTQYVNHTQQWGGLGKFMLFDPNLVDDMNWSVGNHVSHPVPSADVFYTDKVVAFHINKGFSEDYFVQRRQYMYKRLSETNKKGGLCYEYGYSEEQMRNEYRGYQKRSIDISFLLK